MVFWGGIFTIITMNALVYPRVLKVVRNRLRIRSFFPMHFGAFFPMAMLNATIGGTFYGWYRANYFLIKLAVLRAEL
jgi:hypothetical protein